MVIHFSSVATASLQQAAYDGSEAGGSVMVCVELTDGELERIIAVYLSTTDGTAIGKQLMYCRTIICVHIFYIR